MTAQTATEAIFRNPQSAIRNKLLWVLVAVFLAGLAYLSSYQMHISGSWSPYATDVGEIQNAFPRWGLIHHSGYPQYSMLGSLFVTLLRPLGVAPAAGASLFSVLWGLVTVALLVILAMELDVPGPFAALGALATAVSTSIWIDASLAEVHTMTLAISVATLLFALRSVVVNFCLQPGSFSPKVGGLAASGGLDPHLASFPGHLAHGLAHVAVDHRHLLAGAFDLSLPAAARMERGGLGVWFTGHVGRILDALFR